MMLQVAIDLLSYKEAVRIARAVKDSVDIIEAGTPLIKSQGIGVVTKLKRMFPKKIIVADLKTMDTGFLEAEMAFRAGADIATLCSASSDNTIKGALKAAKRYRKKILVDMIEDNTPERARKVLSIGAHYVGIHMCIDRQEKGKDVLGELRRFSGFRKMDMVSVAGGINTKNIGAIAGFRPGIIVVGGAITKAERPGDVAVELRRRIE